MLKGDPYDRKTVFREDCRQVRFVGRHRHITLISTHVERMGKRVAQNVVLYDILISCPGDIIEEREIINEAITRFNDLYSDTQQAKI